MITKESVKKNLMLAHQQQVQSEKAPLIDRIDQQNVPEDPTRTVLKSKSIQRQQIFISFSQGLYPYQEDRAQCVMIQNLPHLTHQNLAENLYQTIMNFGEDYKNEQSGSTLSVFILMKDYLITANVGDSRVMLVKHYKNEYVCERLTWDHKPYYEAEKQRIQKAGGEVNFTDTYRLNGILAVSRTLGDAMVGEGLTHEPDITWVNTKNFKQAYVIACTDGITDTLHEKDIAYLFNQETSLENISALIHHTAFARGSADNMTLILSPILQPKNENNIILGFVADGHGGDEMSEILRNQFNNAFLKTIKNNFPQKNIEPKIISIF